MVSAPPYNAAKPWSYPFELLATAEEDFWDRESTIHSSATHQSSSSSVSDTSSTGFGANSRSGILLSDNT